jgi:hypothetical protein
MWASGFFSDMTISFRCELLCLLVGDCMDFVHSQSGIFMAADGNPSTAANIAKKEKISCGNQCANGSGLT